MLLNYIIFRCYRLRQKNNKKRVVKALKELHYRVFASGDSYNDIEMLAEADLGVFFQAPKHIRSEYDQFQSVESYGGLKRIFSQTSHFVN